MTRDITEIALFSGIDRLLVTLDEAGVELAIVSSNAETNVRRVLGADLAARIDAFACGSSLFGKAAKIGTVVERLGMPAASVLAVGDEVRDIDAAEEAGVAAGAVTWGCAEEGVLRARRPTWIFRAPDYILAAVTA